MFTLPSLDFKYRFSFILHFAILNLKIRFKNTSLGFFWAGLEPLFLFLVLYVVFTSIRQTDENFAIYLISGIMLYHIFSRGTIGGLTSLTSNAAIITSLSIRKQFFPIVTTAAIGLIAIVDVGVFFGLMPIFQFSPHWTIIFLPLPIIITLFLILGFSYILSIVNVFRRDIHFIWAIFVQVLLFVSPTFWKVEEADGFILEIHKINPLGQLMEITHNLVIDGFIPPLIDWVYPILFTAVTCLIGILIFHKFENKIAEVF